MKGHSFLYLGRSPIFDRCVVALRMLSLNIKSSATPPYTLFILFIFRLVGDTLVFGGTIFDYHVLDLPPRNALLIQIEGLNLTATIISLGIILSMPLNIPPSRVDPAEIVRYAYLAFFSSPFCRSSLLNAGKIDLSRGLHVAVGLDQLPLDQTSD